MGTVVKRPSERAAGGRDAEASLHDACTARGGEGPFIRMYGLLRVCAPTAGSEFPNSLFSLTFKCILSELRRIVAVHVNKIKQNNSQGQMQVMVSWVFLQNCVQANDNGSKVLPIRKIHLLNSNMQF
jgi:hypothetical protein